MKKLAHTNSEFGGSCRVSDPRGSVWIEAEPSSGLSNEATPIRCPNLKSITTTYRLTYYCSDLQNGNASIVELRVKGAIYEYCSQIRVYRGSLRRSQL